MKAKTILIFILGVLQLFNGLSGILGGLMLIDDPSGSSLSMKLEWLNKTPFPDFLFPGIILFLFVGLGNVLGFLFSFKNKNKQARFGIIFGLILMSWIIVQIAFIGYKDFLQPLYFTLGLLQAITGFAIMKLTGENN